VIVAHVRLDLRVKNREAGVQFEALWGFRFEGSNVTAMHQHGNVAALAKYLADDDFEIPPEWKLFPVPLLGPF
jgi:hypothetical protein